MEKAIARNPNLLRTLLGLSVTLIIVLGYAIYSASIESEYYHYDTLMNENELSLIQENNDNYSTQWTGSSIGSISWINFTISGAPIDSTLTVTSGGNKWWSHPSLGDPGAVNFNCIEPNQDFQMVNHCEYRFTHTITINETGEAKLHGLISDSLPLSGLGTIRSDNITTAQLNSEEILNESNKTTSWLIKLNSNTPIDQNSLFLNTTFVTHELIDVEKFHLNPVVESIWSLTALITCFFLVLSLPLGIYYASIKREQRIHKIRLKNYEEE